MRNRPLVLFLGNNYNPFSLACAAAVLGAGECSVAIGIHDDAAQGRPSHVIRSTLQRFGWQFLLRRSATLARARLRLLLQRAGLGLPSPVSLEELAKQHRVSWFRCPRINVAPTLDEIRTLRPDLTIVGGFSQILKNPVLTIPRFGSVNVHPSLLPRYRGPNPLYWVLANAEAETGVTVHFMDCGVDSGDIIAQRPIPVGTDDDERVLLRRASETAQTLLAEVIPLLLQGAATRIPQRHEEATYFPNPPRGASRL